MESLPTVGYWPSELVKVCYFFEPCPGTNNWLPGPFGFFYAPLFIIYYLRFILLKILRPIYNSIEYVIREWFVGPIFNFYSYWWGIITDQTFGIVQWIYVCMMLSLMGIWIIIIWAFFMSIMIMFYERNKDNINDGASKVYE